MWEAQTAERTEFVYLLTWPDAPTMLTACAWIRFLADEEWKDIKRVTSAHAQRGDLVGEIEDRTLVFTSYSPSILPSKQR